MPQVPRFFQNGVESFTERLTFVSLQDLEVLAGRTGDANKGGDLALWAGRVITVSTKGQLLLFLDKIWGVNKLTRKFFAKKGQKALAQYNVQLFRNSSADGGVYLIDNFARAQVAKLTGSEVYRRAILGGDANAQNVIEGKVLLEVDSAIIARVQSSERAYLAVEDGIKKKSSSIFKVLSEAPKESTLHQFLERWKGYHLEVDYAAVESDDIRLLDVFYQASLLSKDELRQKVANLSAGDPLQKEWLQVYLADEGVYCECRGWDQNELLNWVRSEWISFISEFDGKQGYKNLLSEARGALTKAGSVDQMEEVLLHRRFVLRKGRFLAGLNDFDPRLKNFWGENLNDPNSPIWQFDNPKDQICFLLQSSSIPIPDQARSLFQKLSRSSNEDFSNFLKFYLDVCDCLSRLPKGKKKIPYLEHLWIAILEHPKVGLNQAAAFMKTTSRENAVRFMQDAGSVLHEGYPPRVVANAAISCSLTPPAKGSSLSAVLSEELAETEGKKFEPYRDAWKAHVMSLGKKGGLDVHRRAKILWNACLKAQENKEATFKMGGPPKGKAGERTRQTISFAWKFYCSQKGLFSTDFYAPFVVLKAMEKVSDQLVGKKFNQAVTKECARLVKEDPACGKENWAACLMEDALNQFKQPIPESFAALFVHHYSSSLPKESKIYKRGKVPESITFFRELTRTCLMLNHSLPGGMTELQWEQAVFFSLNHKMPTKPEEREEWKIALIAHVSQCHEGPSSILGEKKVINVEGLVKNVESDPKGFATRFASRIVRGVIPDGVAPKNTQLICTLIDKLIFHVFDRISEQQQLKGKDSEKAAKNKMALDQLKRSFPLLLGVLNAVGLEVQFDQSAVSNIYDYVQKTLNDMISYLEKKQDGTWAEDQEAPPLVEAAVAGISESLQKEMKKYQSKEQQEKLAQLVSVLSKSIATIKGIERVSNFFGVSGGKMVGSVLNTAAGTVKGGNNVVQFGLGAVQVGKNASNRWNELRGRWFPGSSSSETGTSTTPSVETSQQAAVSVERKETVLKIVRNGKVVGDSRAAQVTSAALQVGQAATQKWSGFTSRVRNPFSRSSSSETKKQTTQPKKSSVAVAPKNSVEKKKKENDLPVTVSEGVNAAVAAVHVLSSMLKDKNISDYLPAFEALRDFLDPQNNSVDEERVTLALLKAVRQFLVDFRGPITESLKEAVYAVADGSALLNEEEEEGEEAEG